MISGGYSSEDFQEIQAKLHRCRYWGGKSLNWSKCLVSSQVHKRERVPNSCGYSNQHERWLQGETLRRTVVRRVVRAVEVQ